MGNLYLHIGDITSDNILKLGDAIVNPTNPMMRFGCGVSGAIFKKAGIDELESYVERRFGITYYDSSRSNEMKVTEVRITQGFKCPCDIIFAQGPRIWDYSSTDEAISMLVQTYQNILDASVKQGYRSILLPSLGTGEYGFTHKQVAEKIISLLKTFINKNSLTIHFVLYDKDAYDIYNKYLYANTDI